MAGLRSLDASRRRASADLQLLQPLTNGRPRPDVAAAYPQYATTGASGYFGFVDVPSPNSIRLYRPADALRATRRHRTRSSGAVPASRPRRRSRPRARVLVVTHNLHFEGAPLIMFEYGRALLAAGTSVRVVSPVEGPLRGHFEALGAAVEVVDVASVFLAASPTKVRAVMTSANRHVDYATSDLVVCNTFTTFWAVHGAKAAGRRVLLYIHESTTPAAFYEGRASSPLVREVEPAFAVADAVSFTAAASRRYHLEYGRPGTALLHTALD